MFMDEFAEALERAKARDIATQEAAETQASRQARIEELNSRYDGTDIQNVLGDQTELVRSFLEQMKELGMPGATTLELGSKRITVPQQRWNGKKSLLGILGFQEQRDVPEHTVRGYLIGRAGGDVVLCEDLKLRVIKSNQRLGKKSATNIPVDKQGQAYKFEPGIERRTWVDDSESRSGGRWSDIFFNNDLETVLVERFRAATGKK
jgi:hypothetical protein